MSAKKPEAIAPSPLRRHAADALRRARRLPVGHARNDLRQLANGLLWLDKRNREATLQDRVNAIFALIDSRSLAQLPARKNADIERVATAVFEVRQAVAANAPSTRKPRFRAAHLLLRFLCDQRSSRCTPTRGGGSGVSPISKFALTPALEGLSIIHPREQGVRCDQ